MALPSIAYSKSVYTAPASDIDGYSAVIDLSNLSADAWTECDSDDATKLRASTDAETELATDTFGYTRASSEGITRVYIGTAYAAASAAARTIRIYLPDSGTESYAASATHGSDNAYDANWLGYWPLSSDFNDRTANGYDGTASGGITAGGGTGKINSASTTFDGSDDFVLLGSSADYGVTAGTILAWANPDGGNTQNGPGILYSKRGNGDNHGLSIGFTTDDQLHMHAEAGFTNSSVSSTSDVTSLSHVAGTYNNGDVEVFINGSSVGSASTALTLTSLSSEARIGGQSGYSTAGWSSFSGTLEEVQWHTAVRSDAWIAQEYDQTNDNATFWSAWSFVPVGFVYMTATPAAPSADVTDFTFIVDLSLAPVGWWTTVDTTDGTKGRVYSADGTTRYAADWIAFDSTGDTGQLRLLKPGTHAAAGATAVRVYPPKAANASVLASDTFGSDNAYDSSWLLYAPLDEGTGTAPADRTANSNDGTFSGAPTWSTGQLGSALDFDGIDDYVNFGDSTDFNLTDYTIFASIKANSLSALSVIAHKGPGWQNNNWLVQFSSSGEINFQARESATSDNAFDITSISTYDDNTWHNVAAALQDGASTPSAELYVDGASVGTDSGTNAIATSQYAVLIGAYREGSEYFHFDGEIDEFQVHSVRRSAAWISSEDDQTNDNATYWGTWTFSGTTPATTAPTAVLSGPFGGPFTGPF